MKLDLIHDIQSVYRKTLNCMARPGTIDCIQEESKKLDINVNFNKSTMILMLMLLDGEVSYKIISRREEEITRIVNQMTFANHSETKDADFIFILSDATPEKINATVRDSKLGDLINPHKSATIIFESEGLSKEKEFTLKGPGIEEVSYARIQAKGNWLEERDKVNNEYPVGIDIIFIDEESNIMCLPRTTQISKQVM
ncbi:phosphonate C-P lyase system protein PhnH [Clostridium bowmanii]|uniref:phosphonate C-P lyase system protein PhnH n=1 Tax=Clostridium bowmanii TaxID=132925 RepID=UPI001C0E57CC|nr:phosphonate C-P lyase system protein PhnH [Clostridium bowmanii]MBU3189664.1 phosphonate C-P lyase system protein PhnH [Clostridium bowmanii]MCA1073491.1 phosphonate C-P lyase system protein PhnH [Clostridium bowmanii]